MTLFNFILWNISPEIFTIGPLTVRWYGLLFALGFLIGQQILIKIYKQEGKSEKHVETITIYMVIATVIGARLGHCFFYEPEVYLHDPIRIFKIWEGGLASHGATVGILIAIFLYSRKVTDQSYLYVLDRLVITIALAGCLIRLGNLMNSEIVGKPTNAPTAFVFVRDVTDILYKTNGKALEDVSIKQKGNAAENYQNNVILPGIAVEMTFKKKFNDRAMVERYVQTNIKDSLSKYKLSDNILFSENWTPTVSEDKHGNYVASIQAYGVPRHPSQLYEAISSFLLFLLLYFIYSRTKAKTPEGRIFGLFVVIIFGLRFIYEFYKENQVDAEDQIIANFGMNIGQLLSVPLIIAGLFILIRSFKKKNEII